MTGAPPVRLAGVGAGLIGARHVSHILAGDCATLAAIVDPAPAARALAAERGVAWFADLEAMLREEKPEGVVIATPNRMHVAHGLECIAAGIPALIEKPIADDVLDATRLVEAAERAGISLLVGHHRRHNPLVARAKEAIDAGRIGDVVAVHGSCWFYKPDTYFDVAWRREAGAGPIFINLIHDIDLVRYLCGEIVSVQAMESSVRRGHLVEDSAVILLRFDSGALGTLTVSDTIVAPWSWEFTSGENPAYSQTFESCYHIGGTLGSLTVPHLDVWRHRDAADWWKPIERERLPVEAVDPLALQVRNFCDVIRGITRPVVSGREGLNTLRVVAAVKQAVAERRTVEVGPASCVAEREFDADGK